MADRRIVHCLICEKPQGFLSTHLARVCMKKNTREERRAEVQRAKESAKNWTKQARNWDYGDICLQIPHTRCRRATVEMLKSRNFFVANVPNPQKMDVAAVAGPAAEESLPSVSGISQVSTQTQESSSTSCEEAEARDPSWQKPQAPGATSVRTSMQKMGLYGKFPAESTVLAGYKKHLVDSFHLTNCQQEVDRVSRMLRFIQPKGDEISADFVLRSQETEEFLNRLRLAKLGPGTIQNYITYIIRFVGYLQTLPRFATADPEFHEKCRAYIDLLGTLRKPISKAADEARHERFVEGQRTIYDCQLVMSVAERDMSIILGKLAKGEEVLATEKSLFRYYCEAILLLEHFQSHATLKGMTATDWLDKKNVRGKLCVSVSDHSRETMQIGAFALNTRQFEFLDAYYQYVRPEMVNASVPDEGRFFLSGVGQPVTSATNDICRLHERYNLPKITSQQIRQVLEREAMTHFSEDQRVQLALYMAQCTPVATAEDKSQTLERAVAVSALILSLPGSSSGDGEGTSRGQKRKRGKAKEGDFPAFLHSFPVSLTGKPPGKKQRIDAGFSGERLFYDKWRGLQYALREEHLLSRCSRRPPTSKKVQRLIQGEGWTANHPRPEDIVSTWKPPTQYQVENDPAIIRMIADQKWSGLAIADCGTRGKGVLATKAFAKGSVICDYHGKVVTKAEGKRMMEAMGDEMGYLFFFRDLCIDAQTFPCQCHPDTDTVGRRINHSRKKFNATPRCCRIQFPEGERYVILLLAAKNIQVNEEIRFDYGVTRKSFGGEGQRLEWLDE